MSTIAGRASWEIIYEIRDLITLLRQRDPSFDLSMLMPEVRRPSSSHYDDGYRDGYADGYGDAEEGEE